MGKIFFCVSINLILVIFTVSAGAALPNQTFLIGATTHFAQNGLVPENNLTLAQQGGISSIRDEILWSSVERAKGVFVVPPLMEQAVTIALAKGIEPLLILDYGNKLYDNRGMPETEEAQQAFVRYAEFLANHFKGKVKHYEVWNEWNIGGGINQKYVFVKSIYRGLLGRSGLIDPTTDSGVQNSISAYEGKTVTKDALIISLFNSAEGQGLYPAALTNADFIDKLYQNCFLRTANQSERDSWSTALGSGSSRADMAKTLVLSPEYTTVWLTKSDSATYVRLLAKSYAALKAIDPAITVIAGAVGGLDNTWINKMMADGALNFMDGISVHPYNFWNGVDGTPEKAIAWIEQLESDLKKYSPTGSEVPIFVTETGWPNDTGNTGTPLELAGDYIGRLFLLAQSRPFIKGIWWYDFQDDGTKLTIAEQNFGLVLRNLTPKPAYYRLQDIAQLIANTDSVEQIHTSNSALWALKFLHSDGTTTLAIWVDRVVAYNKINITFDVATSATVSVRQVGSGLNAIALIDGSNRQMSLDPSGNPWLIHGNLPIQGVYGVTPDYQYSGDLDRDGFLTIKDALIAMKMAVKLVEPTADDLNIGDVAPLNNGKPTQDGKIGLEDSLLLLNKAVGLVNW